MAENFVAYRLVINDLPLITNRLPIDYSLISLMSSISYFGFNQMLTMRI